MKYLILHDIRSAYNVGAIFRTADAAGIHKVYLTGYTPAPFDRFGRIQSEIAKTSLGASATVPWESASTIETLITSLRESGVVVVAIECNPEALSLAQFQVPKKVAYILGNEVTGIPAEVITYADVTVSIPMFGQKESLNVSVAAGIIMYHGVV